MSKILIFAEKPKVALKIAVNGTKVFGNFVLNGQLLTKDYLAKNEQKLASAIEKAGCVENDNYIISFAKGHLIQLCQAKDYDPAYRNWRNIPYQYLPSKFKYKVNSSSEYLYKNLAKLMNRPDVSKIYNAGDADREGELIFRLIYSYCGCNKPVERIWISSQTEDDLMKACKKVEPSSNYDNLGKAGYARSLSDFIMGALLTSYSTVALSGGSEIINVGRVQTTIIAEICRVELLNRNFQSTKYYNVDAVFKNKAGEMYVGTYDEDFDSEDKAKNFLAKLKQKNAKVVSFEQKNEKVYCPPLYNQTALQMEMSAKYNFNPDETLATHQGLYEAGYLSYPRTSSRYIVKGDADDFNRMYKAIASLNPLALKHSFNRNNTRIVNDEKVEGHSAIIPTYELPNLNSLSQKERNLYETVVKRVIAVNYPPAVDNKQSAITSINDFEFFSTGSNEEEKGWREVYDLESKNNALPLLTENEEVEIVDFKTREIITKPPKRYTLASILNFMETCGKKLENEDFKEQLKNKGLGTDATRSSILSGLEDNKYITIKGKTIYPTDKALKLIEIFPVEELKSPEYTGALEYDLYLVSKGEKSYDDFMNKIFDLYKLSCEKIKNSKQKVVDCISDTENSLGKCPSCGGDIVKREGKYGTFYSCSNYKGGCKFSINKICGKLLTEKQVAKLLKDGSVGPIKGLVKKDKTKLDDAYFIIQENKETKAKEIGLSFTKPTNEDVSDEKQSKSLLKCPCCGNELIKKSGKYGEFYGCSNYKNGCRFSINKICGVLLTQKQVQKLLENKKISNIKGMKKKDGTELSNVSIVLNESNEISLVFEK